MQNFVPNRLLEDLRCGQIENSIVGIFWIRAYLPRAGRRWFIKTVRRWRTVSQGQALFVQCFLASPGSGAIGHDLRGALQFWLSSKVPGSSSALVMRPPSEAWLLRVNGIPIDS